MPRSMLRLAFLEPTSAIKIKTVNQEGVSRYLSNRLMRTCMNKVFQTGTVRNTETEGTKVPSMPAKNPTMDERSVMNLKSSDSVNQELLYKDFIPNGEGPVL